MKNKDRVLWALLVIAAAYAAKWLSSQLVAGRMALYADDIVMLAFWLFAMTRAYALGAGKNPFPRLTAWLNAGGEEEAEAPAEAAVCESAVEPAQEPAPEPAAKAEPEKAPEETKAETPPSDPELNPDELL